MHAVAVVEVKSEPCSHHHNYWHKFYVSDTCTLCLPSFAQHAGLSEAKIQRIWRNSEERGSKPRVVLIVNEVVQATKNKVAGKLLRLTHSLQRSFDHSP